MNEEISLVNQHMKSGSVDGLSLGYWLIHSSNAVGDVTAVFLPVERRIERAPVTPFHRMKRLQHLHDSLILFTPVLN